MGLFSLSPKKATPSSGSSHLASSDDRHDHRHGRDEAANDAHKFVQHGSNHGEISRTEWRTGLKGDIHDRFHGTERKVILEMVENQLDRNPGSGKRSIIDHAEAEDLINDVHKIYSREHADRLRDILDKRLG